MKLGRHTVKYSAWVARAPLASEVADANPVLD